MKKFAAILLSLVLTLTVALADSIYVVSREDGSGTRAAFIELTGVEQKDADGNKVDMTTVEAAVYSGTSEVKTTVSQDIAAIGYISLGSMDASVKALKVARNSEDGAEAVYVEATPKTSPAVITPSRVPSTSLTRRTASPRLRRTSSTGFSLPKVRRL